MGHRPYGVNPGGHNTNRNLIHGHPFELTDSRRGELRQPPFCQWGTRTVRPTKALIELKQTRGLPTGAVYTN
jgi:hypothetical protein